METLTKEALKFLKSDLPLFKDVAEYMNITPDTLITLIRKNSKSLVNYRTVEMIAKTMNKSTNEILEKLKDNGTN